MIAINCNSCALVGVSRVIRPCGGPNKGAKANVAAAAEHTVLKRKGCADDSTHQR